MPVENGDHLKAVVDFIPATGGINQNVLHFRAVSAFANTQQIAERIHTDFVQRIAIHLGGGGTFIRTSVRKLDDESEPVGIFQHAWGPGSQQPMPPNLAIKAFLIPEGFGPRHYGKIFMMGCELSWSTGGFVNQFGLDHVGNALGSVLALFGDSTTYGLRWSVRVNKRQPGITFANVAAYNVSNIWSRVGTRRPGVGI